MSSLFKESTIEIIKAIKKGFLWTAVCILIGEVVLGAILILVGSFNETIGKLMGTFALCAIMMFFGVNNFSRMEKGDRIIITVTLASDSDENTPNKKYLEFSESENPDNISDTIVSKNNKINYVL